jgi:diguanylate cyclase (GGDEF)-like protein
MGSAPSGDRARPPDPISTTKHSDTFAQASMLIGQELEVHEFLERLLEILLRHAAATRGYLVLQSTDGPMVEVAAHRVGDLIEGPTVRSRIPGDHPDLCIPALSYTLRTHEVLALVDPASDHRFRSDSALRERSPRALLCLPIGRPSATNGVLVMESDTFSHAFDVDSVEALRVLSTQAIAAIENVRLSSDLGSLADDVANLRARAAALTAQAETDPLTGGAIRNGLQAGFQAPMKALGAAPAGGETRQVGVLFCDLDGFKSVNDRHGHAVGDVVLREVASRLRRVVRTGDIVARVGGDEFVILSVDVPTSELTAIADRALLELRRPLSVPDGPRITISASIGVARADVDALGSIDDVDAVLEIADQAMYRAKHAGKDQVAHT